MRYKMINYIHLLWELSARASTREICVSLCIILFIAWLSICTVRIADGEKATEKGQKNNKSEFAMIIICLGIPFQFVVFFLLLLFLHNFAVIHSLVFYWSSSPLQTFSSTLVRLFILMLLLLSLSTVFFFLLWCSLRILLIRWYAHIRCSSCSADWQLRNWAAICCRLRMT